MDIVKLAFVVMYPWVRLKTLTLASWMNFDEKIEPTDIFTRIGMIYRPICRNGVPVFSKALEQYQKKMRLVSLDITILL